jgi:hypothetical protein
VACFALVRPGYSCYYGHDAMVKLVEYMHDRHGNYQVEIASITVQDGLAVNGPKVRVTAEARILPEPGPGRPPVSRSRPSTPSRMAGSPGSSASQASPRAESACRTRRLPSEPTAARPAPPLQGWRRRE